MELLSSTSGPYVLCGLEEAIDWAEADRGENVAFHFKFCEMTYTYLTLKIFFISKYWVQY